jgi:hypothetical protein
MSVKPSSTTSAMDSKRRSPRITLAAAFTASAPRVTLCGPEGDAVSKATCIAERGCTFEMIDTYEGEICCFCGASEFRITVNGKPIAFSRSAEFRDVARESFDMAGCSSGPTVP